MLSLNTKELTRMIFAKKLRIELDHIFDFFNNKKDYDIFCDYVTNYILDDYSRANEPVEIVCEDGETVEITIFQFLINLYFLEFNFMYKVPITREWMIDVDKQFLASYHNYIETMCRDRIYKIVIKKKLNATETFSWILSNLTERMVRLSELMAPISTPTINLIDLSEFCNRNQRFNELLSTELDDSKSYMALEKELVESGKELKAVIKRDGKSCLLPFIDSNCVNDQQLQQMFVAVGPRMSSSNVVMSHIMKSSYLNSLQNAGDFIAESEIAAKALIYKKKFVAVSGYTSRETNLAGMNLRIDYDMDDCGTKHYINYNIKTQKHLDLIISKNIILPNGKLKEVTEADTNLIGTTVKLRSMCTCAHPNKLYVCKKCYGNPKEHKRDYTIGGATSTEIENPLSNAVMAVKHHTGTKTKEFDNAELLEYFSNVDDVLVLKDVKTVNKVSIWFNKEYIEDITERIANDMDYDDFDDEEIDEDEINDADSKVVSKMLTDLKIVVSTFDEFTNEETENVKEIKLDGSFLTLAEDMLNINNIKKIKLPIDSDTAILDISDLKPGTQVFNIKYITAETSRYLKELKNIIERAKPTWYENLDDPINNFADLIIEAGLKDKELVYIEPIIHALTRSPKNIVVRPNFSKDQMPQLVVINLKTAIFKGDLCSALIYQQITDILKDRDSFFKDPSVGEGLHDTLFKTTVRHDFRYVEKALRQSNII